MRLTDGGGAGSTPSNPAGPSWTRSRLYSGRTSRVVGRTWGGVRTPLIELGGMLHLAGQLVATAVREPRGYWGPTVDYMYETMRRALIPCLIAVGGFIVFLSVLVLVFINQVGAIAVYAPVIFRVTVENLAAWAVALVLAGIVGAALTAELGARRIRDELDAMRVMGIDPIHELVLPRVLSAIILTTLFGVPAVALSMVSIGLAGRYYGDQEYTQFINTIFDNMASSEIFFLLINCLTAGIVIGVVCAYKGLNAGGGSEGLGKAVNQAVVYCFVALWSYQTIYTGVTQGILHFGRFR